MLRAVAELTLEDVVATCAEKLVVARSPEKAVVTEAAIDSVGAGGASPSAAKAA